jgi:hypothetical protein
MKKKLSKYEQLIANLNKASQDLKEATDKAIQTLTLTLKRWKLSIRKR